MEQRTYKAERRTIYLGDIPLEVAMLPNGDYCLSQTQVAGAIDKIQVSIIQFLRSKYFKVNWSKGCELFNFSEVYLEGVNKPIKPIPIKVACLYWQKWAAAGNEKAKVLTLAVLDQTLSERADREFGIHRTDEARNQALKEDLNSNPRDYLADLEQKAAGNVLEFPSKETHSERELQLKIKLAELELQKIKSLEYAHDPSELKKLGTFSPEVLIYLKDRLKLKTWSQAESFLEKVDFGQDSGKWVKVKISGEIDMLPWSSLKELKKICSQVQTTQH